MKRPLPDEATLAPFVAELEAVVPRPDPQAIEQVRREAAVAIAMTKRGL